MVFVMPDLSSAVFWAALWKIIVANIILSGDNAVVIAMACHNLSDKYRRPAIVFGSAGAVVLRIVFCAVIGFLLAVPYLKLVGGALLLWIGVKLITEEEGPAEIKQHVTLWAAISTVVIADAVMSFDNAIAIGAGARGNFALIVVGLLLSVPIIMVGANFIARLLDRFQWVAVVGAALIGWIAGEVIAGDGRFERLDGAGKLAHVVQAGSVADWFDSILPHAERTLAAWGAGFVIVVGLYMAARAGKPGRGS